MNNRIIRTLFVAVGLSLASAPVFAHQGGCGHEWGAEYEHDETTRFEKHMAKLHDALKLTKDQEAAWVEFSNKMKPVKTEKPEQPDWKAMSTPDRLDKMLDLMKTREKKLAERAATIRTFYGALTPDQQKIFDQRFEAYHHRHGRHPGDEGKGMHKGM